MLKLSGSLRKLNEEHAPKLFEKVEEDIEYLQSFQNATWHERLQDPHYMKIRRLYEDNYCPSQWHHYFSLDNQLKYCLLRVQIDDILTKNYIYYDKQ
jgi:hypothetical protein